MLLCVNVESIKVHKSSVIIHEKTTLKLAEHRDSAKLTGMLASCGQLESNAVALVLGLSFCIICFYFCVYFCSAYTCRPTFDICK